MSDAVVAPASRNSPCPCGSGRRYKDCHGALGPAGERQARRSSYRAPGREWAHLDESTRDRFGAAMEQALAWQTAGALTDAARAYAEVVAEAPETHDALHMLGVIELGFGNIDEAARLLAAARPLRPAYAAIEHNWQLVQDALLARSRAQPEQLAERALPILVELALASDAAGRAHRASEKRSAGAGSADVHLIGRVRAGDHDDGWLLRRLADLLGPEGAVVWAVDGDGSDRVGAHRTRRVDGGTGAVPRGGIHVYAGVDFDCAGWIERADAERVIVFCQSAAPTRYLDQLRSLARDGARALELVFVSRAMANRFGPGHAVLPPLLDVATFEPASTREPIVYDEWLIEAPVPWPVGIVGQNMRSPCEPTDGDLVRTLGGIAGHLHIYDPGGFRYLLGGSATTRFFERRSAGLEAFLAGLRCYVHRTAVWWQETAGRELYGAMALGLPVLCPRDSIHAERIEHGVDGFLYQSDDEAARYVSDLRRAPAMAAAVGRAARAKVRTLLDRDVQLRRWREIIAGSTSAGGAQWATGHA